MEVLFKSNEKLTYHCISIRFKHLLTQSISDRTGLIPVSSHVGMGRFLIAITLMMKTSCSMFLPISTCHDTEAFRNVLAFFHIVWINCYLPSWIQLWPWQMVFSRTSHSLALSFFAVLKKHASHCSRHMTNSDFTQSTQGIVHAVICSCKFCACFLEILMWPHTQKNLT